MKKTLVIGTSPNPDKYSYKAVISLLAHGHPIIPLGIKSGTINGLEILKGFPLIENLDTITLYLGAKRQVMYYDYILKLRPKRIIFNPGAENRELFDLARNNNIEAVEACTLVMLSIGAY